MVLTLTSSLEDPARRAYGPIRAYFTFEHMPEFDSPNVPKDFLEALIDVPLPVRANLLGIKAGEVSVGHALEEAVTYIQQDDNPVPVFGLDAISALEEIGRYNDEDHWARQGFKVLEFAAHEGILVPSPALLSA